MSPARAGKPLAELFSNPSFPKIACTSCMKTLPYWLSLFSLSCRLWGSLRSSGFLILCMRLGRLGESSAIYCKLSIITIFKVTSLEVKTNKQTKPLILKLKE